VAANGIFDLKKENGRWYYYMFCSCGRERKVRKEDIKKSSKCRFCVPIKHGLSKFPECNVWALMKDRCSNIKSVAYKNYGGRGIKVCDSWVNSLSNFVKDMGERPSKDYCIDRIDNDGNYEPSNCRWVKVLGSNRNRRIVKLNMEKAKQIRKLYSSSKLTQQSLAGIFGVSRRTIFDIIQQKTWREEKCL